MTENTVETKNRGKIRDSSQLLFFIQFLKAELPHPVYACVCCIFLVFMLIEPTQCTNLEKCGKRMRKLDVATRLCVTNERRNLISSNI